MTKGLNAAMAAGFTLMLAVWLSLMTSCSGMGTASSSNSSASTGSNGSSGSGSGNSGSSAKYLYVANSGSNSISGFKINNDGSLTALASFPVSTSSPPFSLSAAKNSLLVGECNASCELSLYSVAGSTGNLSLSSTMSTPAIGAVLDSSGSFAYTGGGTSPNATVSAFSIVNGNISAIAGSPYQYSIGGGSNPVTATTLLVDPTGKFVYTLMTPQNEHTPSAILAVLLRNSNGSLAGFAPNSPGGSGTAGCTSGNLAVLAEQGTSLLFQSCEGSFQSDFSVQSLLIDQATGNISSTNGFSEPQGGGLAVGLAVDPSGKWLAATDIMNNNVHILAINPANGGLTESQSLIFPTGTGPSAVVFDSTGKFLYVLNGGLGSVGAGSNNISAYAFDASTGMLTAVSGSPYNVGQLPTAIVIAQPQ